VNPVPVMEVCVIANHTPQMWFIDGDDVVEDLAATAPNPAFCGPVLPWRLKARAFWPEAGCLQEGDHIGIEFRVVIQDDIPIGTGIGKCFTQLLQDLIRVRMAGDVEMQNPAPAVLDHEEAIQDMEGQGGHGKEIHGNNGFAMIGKKGMPAPGRIAAAPDASQISGDCAFRNLEAKLAEFSVDPRRSPSGVLERDTANQGPKLLADLWPDGTRPGSPAPLQPEARPMPADHSLRFDDCENIRPSRPVQAQGVPEETIQVVQRGARAFPLEHSDLLPQREDFEGNIQAAAEENANGCQECGDQIEHESTI
jgi:hypothetical protein